MHSQRIDLAFKRLETVIQKKLQDQKSVLNQENKDLLIKISELEKIIEVHQNEIRMLKSIIKETVTNLDDIIAEVKKIQHE